MVSPLKGLTRAQITAQAAAKRAAKAAKKGTRKKRTTKSSTHIRVSQRTVDSVKRLGRDAARAAAAKPGASAEFKEAVSRIYPIHTKRKGK